MKVPATKPLVFDIKRGMLGTCERIIGRIGKCGEEFAEAYFSHIDQKWDVVIFDANQTDYSVDVTDREAAIDQVCALMALEYSRQHLRSAA